MFAFVTISLALVLLSLAREVSAESIFGSFLKYAKVRRSSFEIKNNDPNAAKTASIVSKITSAVNSHPNKKVLLAPSNALSPAVSSATGFVALATYSTKTCTSGSEYVYAGLALSKCVPAMFNDDDDDGKDATQSLSFGCDNNFITMKSFNDSTCGFLLSTTTVPLNLSTCYPQGEFISGMQLTCSSAKESVPVPVGTIVDAVYDDAACSHSDTLGYLGLVNQQCFDLSKLCDSDFGDNPSFHDACNQIDQFGNSVSIQFSCNSNAPSATLYLSSNICTAATGSYPPITQALDTSCQLVDATKGSSFMCKTANDDDTSSTSSSAPAASTVSTGAVVGGVVGGVAAAGAIGYVAYTKVIAKGASLVAKTLASQTANEL